MKKHDIIIIGGGAAGLTAGYFAGLESDNVLVLERTDKAGKKILISGGTRCNILPVRMEYDDYFTDSSVNLMKHIFKSWSLERCKDWLTYEIGLDLSCETETNKWFPSSNSAKEVRNKLLRAMENVGTQIRYNQKVVALRRESDEHWTIQTEAGEEHHTRKVIIATGGLSIPTMGTDGLGHRVLLQLGLQLRDTYPALTPLLCEHPGDESLAGISLECQVTASGSGETYTAKRTGFLFTHNGISGPAVLDSSHVIIKSGFGKQSDFRVNWLRMDPRAVDQWLQEVTGKVVNSLKEQLPARLADALCSELGLLDRYGSELRKEERKRLVDQLTDYRFIITGTLGYKKAEVTGGGLPLERIDTASMESKQFPGLYFCGEVLDVFGRIGGFNFYWAWLTGRLSGMRAGTQ
ncbi:MAG: NAD(P)/FAD-dependent oxidoreductase [Bacteroidota bacterium]